jgi:hypothetical protein
MGRPTGPARDVTKTRNHCWCDIYMLLEITMKRFSEKSANAGMAA